MQISKYEHNRCKFDDFWKVCLEVANDVWFIELGQAKVDFNGNTIDHIFKMKAQCKYGNLFTEFPD